MTTCELTMFGCPSCLPTNNHLFNAKAGATARTRPGVSIGLYHPRIAHRVSVVYVSHGCGLPHSSVYLIFEHFFYGFAWVFVFV